MAEKITLSVIKADIGGYVGHSSSHPQILEKAKDLLVEAKAKGTIIDFYVTNCGDDLELIMTHNKGVDNQEIHKLAWDTFVACTELAKELKLYGAGQDLLADAFSGNVKGMGPGVAEMEFVERKSEPVIIFMGDKCAPGAWNFPLFKIFADPFNTIGLIIDPAMHDGFKFEVHDIKKDENFFLSCPEEMYDLLVLIGSCENYIIKAVYKKDGEIAAVSSTQKLALIAGRYVGKDDPVLIVRAQAGLPAVGEILEPFAFPHLVSGWMRGSHYGPLMPVSQKDANPSRFDGPPRVVALGFQIAQGMLIGPRDLFADPAFDYARKEANRIANFMRGHGPFEPHRLPLEEMEYTTLPEVLKRLSEKRKKA
jgi:fructose 1,6-bisphosphate aldolase/phosphatase|uniref:Fructose-1,6-bisphosphate aldolase/phosphatase n=1 Tax=candidate division WOR-3 bacterium TaxID=2052148 RepID=A0A7V5XZE7_UNCW3